MRLLLATTNPGKIREIRGILAGAPVDLVTLSELPPIAEPEETGTTFLENARLKAMYYAGATGLPSVAEDSGLEIDALDKAPGVHSARWHGTDYAEKFRMIYRLLGERGLETSPARFVTALTFTEQGRIAFESHGVVEGEIARAPAGTGGFGYDPIFFYPPLGCTLAQIDDAAKSELSHRGAAFRAFRDFLIETEDRRQETEYGRQNTKAEG